MQVEAANAEVEAGNKQREGLSASMLQRLKKAAGDYDVNRNLHLILCNH